jgi:serine/threonine protein kinase
MESRQTFACKVIKQSKDTLLEDIVAEKRAIDKICTGAHRNIVKVFRHWGEIWDNVPTYIILMELCDCDLENYLRRQSALGNVLNFGEICDIAGSISAGLAFIHSIGEVHRDLKPKNGLSFA